MPWPQMVILFIWVLRLGMKIDEHGQPKKGTENGWTALVGTLINVGVMYWGGFWDVFWSTK